MTSRKKDLTARVLEYVVTQNLIPRGRVVLVSVSGGADSMVLLNCLFAIRNALDIEIVAAHVDHGLRASSKDDAEFVEEQARLLQIPALVRRIEPGALLKKHRQTIEEKAREVRYRLLREMANEVGAAVILTGHTATDQAETVLMRLIRGTGPLGLSGIAPAREDGFARPLLCTTREEVRLYARNKNIPFKEDPTNLDRRFLRNRIRIEVLPLLRTLNPRIDFMLSEVADDARDLSCLVEVLLADKILCDSGEVGVTLETWSKMPRPLQPYAVLKMFREVTRKPLGLSRSHVEGVLRLTRASTPAILSLPRRVIAKWNPRAGLALALKKGLAT